MGPLTAWPPAQSRKLRLGTKAYTCISCCLPPGVGITSGYDDFVYPMEMEGVPLKLAIPRLNRIMVQDSEYAIAYVTHS